MNKYFSLNPECFLIAGGQRSVVYNLDSGELIWLNSIQTQALAEAESRKPIDKAAPIYGYLAEKGWGFYSERPVFIDKARPTNVFGDKRFWLHPPSFKVLMAQVTTQCNQACGNCGQTFCPICFSSGDPGRAKPQLHTQAWLKIIEQAAAAGCQSIFFTGGECLLREDLPALLEKTTRLGLAATIHTNGRSSLRNIPGHINISVLCNQDSDTNLLFKNLQGRPTATIIFQDINPEDYASEIAEGWTVRTTLAQEMRRNKETLHACRLDTFFYKKQKDPCLNGAMYILADGGLTPCFQKRGLSLGNLAQENFLSLYGRLIEEYWYAPLDRRTVGKKCHFCELAYACGACRFSEVRDSCVYDPLGG